MERQLLFVERAYAAMERHVASGHLHAKATQAGNITAVEEISHAEFQVGLDPTGFIQRN